MFGDNKDYNFFVIILVAAIIVSLAFHFFLGQDVDAEFSEVYFPEPDSLPNDVLQDELYNYSFTIANHEGVPFTYSYNTTLEIFNLYDVTEGIYKCAAQQRKKVYLKWVNESPASENSPFALDDITGFAAASDDKEEGPEIIFSESDDYAYIDWPHYTAEYSYENTLAAGAFTTLFHDNDYVKYSFTIYEDTGEVKFGYMDNGIMKYEVKKTGELGQSNEIVINATDKLDYYINRKLIFSMKIDNFTNGKFSFTANDTYVLLGGFVLYKDSKIQLTRSKNIRDYEIDNSLVFEKLEEIRTSSEDNYYLIRNITNAVVPCREQECISISSFLNAPNTSLFKTVYGPLNETEIIGLSQSRGQSSIRSFQYVQNSSAPELFWPNYTLKVHFETFVKFHTILFNFEDKLMVMLHENNAFFIELDDNETRIYRRTNYVEIGVNELSLESTDDLVILYLNQVPIFSTKRALNLNKVSVYTKNTLIALDDISAARKDKGCRAVSLSKECRRAFKIPAERRSSSVNQPRITAEPLILSAGLAAAPFLGAQLFDVNPSDGQYINDTFVNNLSLSRLIDYELDIDPSLINNEIPSERYNFDGRNARIANMANYTFSFNFDLLDGLGFVESSFFSDDKKSFIKFMLYRPLNELYLFRTSGASLLKDSIKLDKLEDKNHNFEVKYENSTTTYYLDNKRVFDVEGFNISSGFFSISTLNTYADFRDIRIYDGASKRYIPYYINKDPCSLRKISEIIIDEGSLYLDEGENRNISRKFIIDMPFDYGRVNVNLAKPGVNASEIHFWMVNND